MLLAKSILCGLYDIVEVICLISVLTAVFGLKERKRSVTIVVSVICFLTAVGSGLWTYFGTFSEDSLLDPETMTMLLPPIFVFVILNTKGQFWKSLGAIALVMSSSEALIGFIGFIFKNDARSIEWVVVDNTATIIGYTTITVAILIANKISNFNLIKNVYETVPKWLLPVWFLLNFTVFFADFAKHDVGYDNELPLNIFFSLSALSIFICIIYFVYKIFLLSYQQTQILKQLNEQHENYERMLASDQQLREFRHDYKNHMLVVTALLNAGKNEEAAEYLETIKITSGVQKRQISTGNFVADAMLNNKNALAEELGIRMTFTGTIPEKGIASSDLCTILGNLVDNAIESTKRLSGEKYIRIEANARELFFVLSIVNPVNERVVIKNNRIKTSKSDVKNHGIGLKNVGRIAEKYGGKFRLSCDDREFVADISIKLQSQEEVS